MAGRLEADPDSSGNSVESEVEELSKSISSELNLNVSATTADEKKVIGKSSVRSKFDDPKLDPAWLYSTLRKEICREASYNLENDAKMRAVTQGTVNYEQFRQMVLGAQIRPLAKDDKVEGCQNGRRPYVVWNTAAKANGTTKASQSSAKVTERELEEGKPNHGLFSPPKMDDHDQPGMKA